MSTKIQKVQNQPNFPELENKINQFWKENKTFQKSVEERDVKNPYVFVDGPPFVTGSPHYGSLLPSIAKDVVPRYWTMKGKRVRRVFGWDCHGLPIEEKINKKFNITSRKQIEQEFTVEKYVQECRKHVEECTSDWRWYIEKIGRWVDLDNAYYTMKPEFNESVIWAFKQIWEKGLIYQGKRVSMFSTDTSTPVSQFEVAMDPDNYRDTQDLSIFAKFKLKNDAFLQKLLAGLDKEIHPAGTLPDRVRDDKKSIHIVAWTTTPWTIPANFALAVNENFTYALVDFEGEYLILSKDRLAYTFQTKAEHIGTEGDSLVKILAEFPGTALEGLEYEPIYDYFVDQKTEKDFHVYLLDDVTNDDGSGVLHIAPGFGEVDFNAGKKFGLSDYVDIDEAGKMIVGNFKGTYLRDASPLVAEEMQSKGNLLRSENYTHNLPFYRGNNPLIYMAQEAYFIDIQKIKQRTLELNQEINWVPDHVKEGRFKHTLETSPDWCISRNRYWATIMPLWQSEDGDQIVVGSFEEMMQYTDQITKKEENGKVKYYVGNEEMTLHRDVCDQLIFTKDGKKYHRVPEVLDCWMDSGSVPFAEYHYPFENKDTLERAFPADYIIEYVGQVRAWFNVLLRLSTMIFDKAPFKNVICTGVLAGNDGRKMSKSFGNYPDPKEVLENVGGEALRLYLMGSAIMVGGDMNWSDEVLNEQVKNILIPLWNTYKYLTIYAELHNWNPESTEYTSKNVLDKWMESYMNKVSLEYAKAIEAYDIPASIRLIQPTIDNISAWWIRRSRDRFVTGDQDAMQTLYATLVQFTKTFAPQMPFVTEEMYQNLVVNTGVKGGKESVHLDFFPEIDPKSVNQKLLDDMDVVRKVCSLGQNIRVANALKVRQPLAKAFINLENTELQEIVKDELNVKEIAFSQSAHAEDGFLTMSEQEAYVSIDTRITSELKEEGLVAELKRAIQNLRKTSGLKMGETVKIELRIESEELREVVKKYDGELRSGVGASEIKLVDSLDSKNVAKVEGNDIAVEFVK